MLERAERGLAAARGSGPMEKEGWGTAQQAGASAQQSAHLILAGCCPSENKTPSSSAKIPSPLLWLLQPLRTRVTVWLAHYGCSMDSRLESPTLTRLSPAHLFLGYSMSLGLLFSSLLLSLVPILHILLKPGDFPKQGPCCSSWPHISAIVRA